MLKHPHFHQSGLLNIKVATKHQHHHKDYGPRVSAELKFIQVLHSFLLLCQRVKKTVNDLRVNKKQPLPQKISTSPFSTTGMKHPAFGVLHADRQSYSSPWDLSFRTKSLSAALLHSLQHCTPQQQTPSKLNNTITKHRENQCWSQKTNLYRPTSRSPTHTQTQAVAGHGAEL